MDMNKVAMANQMQQSRQGGGAPGAVGAAPQPQQQVPPEQVLQGAMELMGKALMMLKTLLPGPQGQ